MILQKIFYKLKSADVADSWLMHTLSHAIHYENRLEIF